MSVLTYQHFLQAVHRVAATQTSDDRISTIDMHTEGEPLRVLMAVFPLGKEGVLPARRKFQAQYDFLRTALMWEPRGHTDMYGCVIVPPKDSGSDFGTFFLHNEGYSSMCGHAIIALATLFAKKGWGKVEESITSLKIEVPAGVVHAFAQWENDMVKRAFFDNGPSFVAGLDLPISLPSWGNISIDLSFGGAFYAYVDADQMDLNLAPEHTQTLIQAGMEIKQAVANTYPDLIRHPTEPELSFLYGTIFTSKTVFQNQESHSRHVCIFADGEVDRSPTGTGVSGRLAILYQRGEIQLLEEVQIESILGSRFSGQIMASTHFGPHVAIIPRVGGRAWLTGEHSFYLDPEDPWRNGFLLK
ncbi:MAG: proline racemase family protein [Bacteroidota bacterium]